MIITTLLIIVLFALLIIEGVNIKRLYKDLDSYEESVDDLHKQIISQSKLHQNTRKDIDVIVSNMQNNSNDQLEARIMRLENNLNKHIEDLDQVAGAVDVVETRVAELAVLIENTINDLNRLKS
jgi:predicted Holliday junction resolvase-like endonuclease